MELKAGHKIYGDGENVYVCDANWHTLLRHPLPATIIWDQGNNKVSVQCDFSSSKAPSINVEFKALGNKEVIMGK